MEWDLIKPVWIVVHRGDSNIIVENQSELKGISYRNVSERTPPTRTEFKLISELN